VAAVAEALTLACPQGYVWAFTDEGPPMGALLGRLVAAYQAGQPLARRIPSGCLARLVQQSDGKPAVAGRGAGRGAVPGLVEQLTGRELEVLRMLAKGMPDQAIADELFVTLFLVKARQPRP